MTGYSSAGRKSQKIIPPVLRHRGGAGDRFGPLPCPSIKVRPPLGRLPAKRGGYSGDGLWEVAYIKNRRNARNDQTSIAQPTPSSCSRAQSHIVLVQPRAAHIKNSTCYVF